MSDQLPVPAASNTFERIKRVSSAGADFWSARELARVLEYSEFRHFLPVVEKAREACLNSAHRVEDHFEQILDMVSIGSGAQRPVEDWKLSRYACYLVIQNADPGKPLVALGQSYFAVQTRRQELAEAESLKEDQKRLLLRQEMTKHNKHLAGVAKQSGVVQPVDYAIFMDHGYRGLYGGLGMRDIHERKRLKPREHILDHMGSTELAANLFRATQTEEKLRRENVRNKDHANRIHTEVGRKVRKTIHELGGTMPEIIYTILFRRNYGLEISQNFWPWPVPLDSYEKRYWWKLGNSWFAILNFAKRPEIFFIWNSWHRSLLH